MDKIKVTISTIGHIPSDFSKRKILNWDSEVFTIVGEIENYSLTTDSDGRDWEYSDSNIESLLPVKFSGNFLVAIVNVPLDYNWYTRRLTENRIVFTFHEIKNILDDSNIPLNNIVLRLLYAYSLFYKRNGEDIPENNIVTDFTHDETRGCLFDMNGIKSDIVNSCHDPIICSDCVERIRKETVSNELITKVQAEIRRIKKPLFYRILSFVKSHPVWSIFISAVSAIILGSIGSYIATILYEATKNTV